MKGNFKGSEVRNENIPFDCHVKVKVKSYLTAALKIKVTFWLPRALKAAAAAEDGVVNIAPLSLGKDDHFIIIRVC